MDIVSLLYSLWLAANSAVRLAVSRIFADFHVPTLGAAMEGAGVLANDVSAIAQYVLSGNAVKDLLLLVEFVPTLPSLGSTLRPALLDFDGSLEGFALALFHTTEDSSLGVPYAFFAVTVVVALALLTSVAVLARHWMTSPAVEAVSVRLQDHISCVPISLTLAELSGRDEIDIVTDVDPASDVDDSLNTSACSRDSPLSSASLETLVDVPAVPCTDSDKLEDVTPPANVLVSPNSSAGNEDPVIISAAPSQPAMDSPSSVTWKRTRRGKRAGRKTKINATVDPEEVAAPVEKDTIDEQSVSVIELESPAVSRTRRSEETLRRFCAFAERRIQQRPANSSESSSSDTVIRVSDGWERMC